MNGLRRCFGACWRRGGGEQQADLLLPVLAANPDVLPTASTGPALPTGPTNGDVAARAQHLIPPLPTSNTLKSPTEPRENRSKPASRAFMTFALSKRKCSNVNNTIANLSNILRLIVAYTEARLLKTFGHKHPALSACISPDGKWLATGHFQKDISRPASVRLYDSKTRQLLHSITLENFKTEKGVVSVAFSPNGKLFMTASADRTVRLWES